LFHGLDAFPVTQPTVSSTEGKKALPIVFGNHHWTLVNAAVFMLALRCQYHGKIILLSYHKIVENTTHKK